MMLAFFTTIVFVFALGFAAGVIVHSIGMNVKRIKDALQYGGEGDGGGGCVGHGQSSTYYAERNHG